MLRAVIYNRISDQAQVGNTSLENQKNACLEFAARQGYTVADVLVDEAVSAKGDKASNIKRVAELLKYIKTKKFDVLVVWKLDRLGRDIAQTLMIKNALYPARLESVTEPSANQDTPTSTFLSNVLMSVSQLDNEVRSERSRQGMIDRLMAGFWPTTPPCGYYKVKKDGMRIGECVVDEGLRPAVIMAYELFSQGFSYLDVAKILTSKKFINHKGKQVVFKRTGVEKMVHNPFYIGQIQHSLISTVVKARHEPIVGVALWRSCQVERSKHSGRVIVREEFPLRQFVCNKCGHKMTASFATGSSGGRYGYYYCLQRGQGGLCGGNYTAKAIHDGFLALLDTIQPAPEGVELFKALYIEKLQKRFERRVARISELEKAITRLLARKQNLKDMRLDGDIGPDEYRKDRKKIDGDVLALQTEMHQIQNKNIPWEGVVRFGSEFITSIADKWDSLEVDGKRIYQGSIFDDFPVWNGKSYRTPKVLEVFSPFIGENIKEVSLGGSDSELGDTAFSLGLERLIEVYRRFLACDVFSIHQVFHMEGGC